MNKKLLTLLSGLFIFSTSESQVTKLNNNGNIHIGLPVGSIGIMNTATTNQFDSLWRTDGTSVGTYKWTKFMDFGPFTVPGYVQLLHYKNKIVFPGRDNGGVAIYHSDGTVAGTSNVRSGSFWNPHDLFVFNNFVLSYGRYSNASDNEPYIWNGASVYAEALKDINPGGSNSELSDKKYFFNATNGIVFFRAFNTQTGAETYRTDGTSAGTYLLKDVSPNVGINGGHIEMEALGNLVIYSAETIEGVELYKSDGTTGGTELLKDIAPGVASSNPAGFLVFNNKMYFTANNGLNGSELWVTDGTTAGTVLVKDINTGTGNSSPNLSHAIIFNNKFLFTATTPTNGTELWVSDGTEAGTQFFKDINLGSGSSNPNILLDSSSNKHSEIHSYLFNGKVFFYADNGNTGNELWISDGTPAGTQLVKDINTGSASSPATGFSKYSRSGLYFTADNGVNGNEVWRSDGTELGTSMVADINVGASSSLPRFLMVMNEELYITADDGDNTSGLRDLYKINGQFVTLPLTLANFSATAAGQSAVLKWTTTNEVNTSHTEVEPSADGTTFTSIGKVTSNNAALNSYTFTDVNAVAGNNYYRLKFIDKDGAFQYSSVKLVTFKGVTTVVINNNPVSNTLRLSVNLAKKSNVGFSIVAADGRLVKRVNMSLAEGKTQKDIDVSDLAKGTYILTMYEGSNKVTSSKFLKQ